MQQGLKDGAAPKANLTYMEEESRNAFQTGKASLLRNWPYVYSLGEGGEGATSALSRCRHGRAVRPASVLGGYNLGISAYSKNPGLARVHQLRDGPGRAEQVLRPSRRCRR